jgi:hypothetical protein
MTGFSVRPHCKICSLPLRSEKSITEGIGPKCKKKMERIRETKKGRIGELIDGYIYGLFVNN